MKLHNVLSGLLVAGLILTVHAEEPIVIKFSHVVTADTPKGKAAEHFKKLAEEYTKGKVKVEVYPNSQLYKDKDELEALQIGAVQMLAPSLAKFGHLGVREFEIFDLPYIFDDYKALHNVTQGKIGKELLKKLEAKGILGLAFWDNGFKQMSANKPLRNPEDFKGLKMRIQSSKIVDLQMRSLSANPQVMAFSDVYQALQTGAVDGTENPVSNFYTQNMHEVQQFLTLSNHGYLGYAVIVNKNFWKGLPADIRTALEKAMDESTHLANDIAKKENDDALAQVKASGKTEIIVLSVEEKVALKKAMIIVHDKQNRISKTLIESIHKATDFKE